MKRIFVGFLLMSLATALSSNPCFADFTEIGNSVGLDTAGAKDAGLIWVDLNNDGYLDVFENLTSTSRIFFSNGNASSLSFTDVTATRAAGLLANDLERQALAIDLNNDGFLDLVRSSGSSSPVRFEIYLNQGSSATTPYSFGDSSQDPNYVNTALTVSIAGSVTRNFEGVAAMDYNNDNYLDLVADNHVNIRFFGNPGDGSVTMIEPSTPPINNGGWTAGDYLAVTDYNVDGLVDIFPRLQDSGTVFPADIYVNQGSSTFTTNASIGWSVRQTNTGGMLLCDFDNDGDFDLFISDGINSGITANSVQFQTGSASGNFNTADQIVLPTGAFVGDGVDGSDCSDVDNDGDLDLFLSSEGNDFLFLNNIVAGVASFSQNNLNITGAGNGESAAFGDFDNDGDQDC
ncbi:MAG: VCBS repeat-containing protein [Bdellovibrionota bacterium]